MAKETLSRATCAADSDAPRIRALAARDVPAVLEIIAAARAEYGMAERLDSVLEPADLELLKTYQRERSAYFVAMTGSRVVGGAGIAPLAGADDLTCELQRMYLRADVRGRGLGSQLLKACTDAARTFGFQACYAETIHQMQDAIRFYIGSGFHRLEGPIGQTGHEHNDCWLLLDMGRD